MTAGRAILDLLRGVEDPAAIKQAIDQLTVEERAELISVICNDITAAAKALVRNSDEVWQTKQMPPEVEQLATPYHNTGEQ